MVVGLLLLGCQERLSILCVEEPGTIATKAGADEYTIQTSEPFVFSSECDFNAWTCIKGLNNRFKACEVPETHLSAMTTEGLVKTVVKYPLNYIIFAYDDPMVAVEQVVNNSPLHQELLRRSDAVGILVDYYSRFRPSLDMARDQAEGRNNTIPLESDSFLGYFLGYLLPSGLPDSISAVTITALLEKKHVLEYNVATFGLLPLQAINHLFDSIFSDPVAERTQIGARDADTVHIYTPFLQELVGDVHVELSSSEISYLDNLAQTQYPDATMLGHASALYNSHSYAWHSSSTDNTVWLDKFYSGSFQLYKYWIDDLYEVYVASGSQKIVYDASSSALICSNGKHRSKWGYYPLMEHDPTDCPYNTDSGNYYREKPLPLLNDNVIISGPATVNPNVATYYSITYPASNTVHYSITAESLVTGNTYSFTHLGGSDYILTCYDYGAYKIYVRGYAGLNNSYYYSFNEKLVGCIPSKGANKGTGEKEAPDVGE